MAHRFQHGGRLFTFGNGGSATDAEGTAELFRAPTERPPLAALSLVDDRAVLTALANDVGFELVFSRQIIAHARPGDIAMGFSTSGDSVNVLRAFDEAARRGLLTIGLCGLRRRCDGERRLTSTTAWSCGRTASTASRRRRTRWCSSCGRSCSGASQREARS